MEYTEAELLEEFCMFAANREYMGNVSRAEAENGAYQDFRSKFGSSVPAPKAVQEMIMSARREIARANATGL